MYMNCSIIMVSSIKRERFFSTEGPIDWKIHNHFFIASILAILSYFILEKNMLQYIWIGSLLIGIALSGTAVSGDRMRANQTTGSESYNRNYFLYPLIVCIPFFIYTVYLTIFDTWFMAHKEKRK